MSAELSIEGGHGGRATVRHLQADEGNGDSSSTQSSEPEGPRSVGSDSPCTHHFANQSSLTVSVLWVNYLGKEVQYHLLQPGFAHPQQTYTTHFWRIRDTESKRLLKEYAGPAATFKVQQDGTVAVQPWRPEEVFVPKPEWGRYRKRSESVGIPIMAYDCVGDAAVEAACHLVARMLQHTPEQMKHRLVEQKACVAIIGRTQVTSDIPGHTRLKLSKGGRDLDTTARGLGGIPSNPVTSCGEENLTMHDDSHYPMENILIHELGHTVMNIGMTAEERSLIQQLYKSAKDAGMYSAGIYMMENADEYWAEGCQSWFDATIRCDVNDGINTREKLKSHDPGLASALTMALGDGDWRYTHDSPAALSFTKQDGAESGRAGAPAQADVDLKDQSMKEGASTTASAASSSAAAAAAAAIPSHTTGHRSIGATTTEAPLPEEMDRARLVSTDQSLMGSGLCQLLTSPGHCMGGCWTALQVKLAEHAGATPVIRDPRAAMKET